MREDGVLYILPCGDTSDPAVYRFSRETACRVKPPGVDFETAAPGTWTNFELGACPWTQGSVCKEERESTDTGRLGERMREDGVLYILPYGTLV